MINEIITPMIIYSRYGSISDKSALACLIVLNMISLSIMLIRTIMWYCCVSLRYKKYINSVFTYIFGDLTGKGNDNEPIGPFVNTITILLLNAIAVVILLSRYIETLL
jgi:hypothetical protein